LRSERMQSVVFGSDWSGSTFGDLVDQFHVEKQQCLDELRPSKLIDIGFDTRIVSEREYLPGDLVDKKIGGGGGTCFKELFRRISEMQPAPKVVVVLTDLCGTFPDDPGIPTIWVVYGGASEAPFGQVIKAD